MNSCRDLRCNRRDTTATRRFVGRRAARLGVGGGAGAAAVGGGASASAWAVPLPPPTLPPSQSWWQHADATRVWFVGFSDRAPHRQ